MSLAAFDCIAQSVLLLLSDITDVCQVSDFSDFFKVTVLSCLLKVVFKFIVLVEMVLKGSFVSACDYDDVLDS